MPERPPCAVHECDRPSQKRVWCQMHYQRWRRYGDVRTVYRPPECSIEGCSKPHEARGWCPMHYSRWRAHGDPIFSLRNRPPLDRFQEKVDVSPQGCWLWTSVTDSKGYGQFYPGGGRGVGIVRAHRWAYEHFIGPIPEGLEIDHLCRVRHCVNPEHLEPVTHYENIQRRVTAQRERGVMAYS